MGIESFLVCNSLTLAVAQRLVRRICMKCREAYTPSHTFLESLGLKPAQGEEILFYRGKGCKKCNQMGYKGRMSLMEVLPMTDGIREMVLKSAPSEEIKKVALNEGMRPLIQDGWIKVLKGITTLDEVMRVTNISSE